MYGCVVLRFYRVVPKYMPFLFYYYLWKDSISLEISLNFLLLALSNWISFRTSLKIGILADGNDSS